MSQPALQGLDLSRSFGAGATLTWALRNASLDLQRGEIVLLMGPSGSGKSTLLAVLSGLLRPTGGQALALGKDLWQLGERERERFRLQHCGFIFQGYNLFPALPARGQLEIVLRWGAGASTREARRRAGDLLEQLGLGDKMHLRPSALSGGEKQRVAVGRALIKAPDLCFADEPTSALDWPHGEQVVRLLQDAAHQRGAAVLVVSHDARIIPFVDRVLHIEDGRLQGAPVEAPYTGRERAMKRLYRSLLIGGSIGLLLLGFTLTQAHWILFSRAGGTPATDPSAPVPPPGTGRVVVATGYVDVEGGITPLQPLPGRVESIPVHENQAVQAGTVLLRMDNRQALALLHQAEADVEAAHSQRDEAGLLTEQQAIKEAQQLAAIDAMRNRAKAAEELLARREELDQAKLAGGARETAAARASVAEARAVLRVEENKLAELRLNDPKIAQRRAEAALRARQGRLEEAQLALQECELTAPVDGTVLRIQVSKGEMLGKEPKRPAILFCPQSPRIIRAEVEQEFAPRVFLKQKAVIEDDTTGAGHWTGQVTRLSDWYTHRRSIIMEPLQQNDVRTLECIITVDPGQPPLRIGQRVRVKLQS